MKALASKYTPSIFGTNGQVLLTEYLIRILHVHRYCNGQILNIVPISSHVILRLV